LGSGVLISSTSFLLGYFIIFSFSVELLLLLSYPITYCIVVGGVCKLYFLATVLSKSGIEEASDLVTNSITSHALIMCQETAPAAGSIVDQDDGIIIRRYESSDEEQVRHLFRIGMESLIPQTTKAIVKYHALSLVSLPAVVAGAAMNRSMGGKQSSLWVAAAAAAVLPVAGLYYYVKYNYGQYVQGSLADDLSKIEEVYCGKSVFLVAVDTRSENGSSPIVGMVAGHNREDDGVIELRRMSVLSKRRGLGLGKRLVRRLEEECKGSKKMFLTCISAQYQAHRLYGGAGFIRKIPATPDWWFRNIIEFYVFEKEY
jgi:GNAT superfamily N-acetyltransferase